MTQTNTQLASAPTTKAPQVLTLQQLTSVTGAGRDTAYIGPRKIVSSSANNG